MNIYDALLEKLNQNDDVYFVQVGAMDGIAYDPIQAHVRKYNWSGLLVEPLPEYFEQLKANYSDNTNLVFENVAISDKAENRVINCISEDVIKEKSLPEFARGISSFFTDRNDLRFGFWKRYITEVMVECITLDMLLTRNNVKKIDLLQIDTEGFDYQVLKQLDFTMFKPKIIHMEYMHLPEEERVECIALFKRHNYKYKKYNTHDIIATLLDVDRLE
jgi:FkbM family methyltransferase